MTKRSSFNFILDSFVILFFVFILWVAWIAYDFATFGNARLNTHN